MAVSCVPVSAADARSARAARKQGRTGTNRETLERADGLFEANVRVTTGRWAAACQARRVTCCCNTLAHPRSAADIAGGDSNDASITFVVYWLMLGSAWGHVRADVSVCSGSRVCPSSAELGRA